MNPNKSQSYVRFLTIIAILLLIGPTAAFSQDRPKREFKLEAESPAFRKLISKDAKLETIATGFGFTEGPVWDKSGFVYVSDEEINKIFRVYPDGHKEELIALGDPDGNTYDRQLRLITCGGVFNHALRSYRDNLVVYAVAG